MISNWPTFQKSSFEFKFNAATELDVFWFYIYILTYNIFYYSSKSDFLLMIWAWQVIALLFLQMTTHKRRYVWSWKEMQEKFYKRRYGEQRSGGAMLLLPFGIHVVCMKRIIGLYKLSPSQPPHLYGEAFQSNSSSLKKPHDIDSTLWFS